jgi:serine/threonine protein kinase
VAVGLLVVQMKFGDFEKLEFLQSGGWGKVYSGKYSPTQQIYALKFFGYTNKKPVQDSIRHEIAMMKIVEGVDGFVQLQGTFLDTYHGVMEGKSSMCSHRRYPVIVMELLQMDIFTFISTTTQAISEEYLVNITRRFDPLSLSVSVSESLSASSILIHDFR